MLEQFERSTRLACCATCVHWRTHRRRAYCPILRHVLARHLEEIGCAEWQQERIDGFAIEDYERLLKNGAK